MTLSSTVRHRVVIVGSGFGGLFAAKSLAHVPDTIEVIFDQSHQPPFVPACSISGGHGDPLRRTDCTRYA